MLATIIVVAKDYQSNNIQLRALCDSGCQINLFTTNAAQKLRLHKSPTQTRIIGLGGIQTAKGKVNLKINSIMNPDCIVQSEMFINTHLVGPLPQVPVDTSEWPSIRRLPLADPNFDQPGPIDMILGAQFYSQIIQTDIRRFPNGPTAQKTSFGWIMFGQANIPMCQIAITAVGVTNDDLMLGLTRFWEMENAPMRHHRTQEEQMCEEIFISTIKRDATGRFMANIPIVPNPPKVIGSRQLA